MDFIDYWKNHPAGSTRRKNLELSDDIFENAFLKVKPDDAEYVKPRTLLYRVHHKLLSMPNRNDFRSKDEYQYAIDYVKRMNGDGKINFDNHWVSFTKNPKVITDSYFKNKGLTGDVIIIKSEKAIDISEYNKLPYNEEEVVAPLNERNVLEILTSKKFKEKYFSE